MTDQPASPDANLSLNENLSLGAEFPPPELDQWRALAEKALRGADFNQALVSKSFDGLETSPLYTSADWPSEEDPSGLPGGLPLTRGMRQAKGPRDQAWDIRACHSHPDPKATNKAILEDLKGGVTSLELLIDPTAETGICVHSLADLEEVLQGVHLEMAPVTLTARGSGMAASALLAALWQKKNIAPHEARGAFNVNPISTFLATGKLPCSAEEALTHVAAFAAYVSETYPHVTTISVDARITNDGGASGPQGLGNAMSTGLAYLRAMSDQGMSIEDAANQITFILVTDANFYENIIKIRVARKLWGRIISSCGGDVAKVNVQVHAENVTRMMTERDPWVNILRTTVAAFGAVLGGVDSNSVLPFTHALGQPTSFARRVARNSQIILAEESNIAKVMDPAGGAFALEKLTDDCARIAWDYFQQIERQGGIIASIRSGWLQSWIATAKADRADAIATRRMPITGVTEFPNLAEQAVLVEPVDRDAIRAQRSRSASGVPVKSASFTDLVDAAGQGALISELMSPFETGPETCVPLKPYRRTEGFEALRDLSDARLANKGARPKIFLCNIGTLADFTARATFARNAFEAGGIEAHAAQSLTTPQDAARAFKASGAKLAILCSSNRTYKECATVMARALKAAGATRLYLAGDPGSHAEVYDQAGIDDFIFTGCDLLQVLTRAYQSLGEILRETMGEAS